VNCIPVILTIPHCLSCCPTVSMGS
jgi:hypothetical protein